jgi:hypothetical protein
LAQPLLVVVVVHLPQVQMVLKVTIHLLAQFFMGMLVAEVRLQTQVQVEVVAAEVVHLLVHLLLQVRRLLVVLHFLLVLH